MAAAFVWTFLTDFLIHGLWLAPDYRATAEVWRPEVAMQARFIYMVLGHVLMGVVFAVLWAKSIWRGPLAGAVFGFWMGAFQHVVVVFTYVAVPVRGDIAAKWIAAGMLQAVVLGVLVALIYHKRGLARA
ncbi:hypothetical protein BH20VER2_BH20VER2_05460 [soil metagenome]